MTWKRGEREGGREGERKGHCKKMYNNYIYMYVRIYALVWHKQEIMYKEVARKCIISIRMPWCGISKM